MRKLIFLILCGCLVGCQPHDERDYRLHPQKLQKAYERCGKLSPSEIEQSERCSSAFKAGKKVKALIIQFLKDRHAFSQELLHQQMALGALKEKPDSSKERMEELSLDIQSRLAVIRFVMQQMSQQ